MNSSLLARKLIGRVTFTPSITGSRKLWWLERINTPPRLGMFCTPYARRSKRMIANMRKNDWPRLYIQVLRANVRRWGGAFFSVAGAGAASFDAGALSEPFDGALIVC